jgi:FtsZ-interacting cell division protein ZipA
MDMQRDVLIVIGVVALALVLALVWVTMQRRRREHLKRRFGPEYDQTVQHRKDLREAERELEARERRVAKFDIRPLSREDAARFTEAWRRTQARFVDDPQGAVTDADRLVTELMDARGYPISDFAQRAADISVDHPRVVVNYRAARAIAERHAHGEASTEDLRQALVHYRELFSDLLETQREESERQPIRRAAGAGGGR